MAIATAFDRQGQQREFRQPSSRDAPYPALREAVRPTVESFNCLSSLLERYFENMGRKVVMDAATGKKITFWLSNVSIGKPFGASSRSTSESSLTTPAHCRQRHSTYKGRLTVSLHYEASEGAAVTTGVVSQTKQMGFIPIMLGSRYCHLDGKSPKELIAMKEEAEEVGGYFIVNGIERVIRFLSLPLRNYPMASIRATFKNRHAKGTEYAVLMRCVGADEVSRNVAMHYLTDGGIVFRIKIRATEFYMPLLIILKALVNCSDKNIYDGVLKISASFNIANRVEKFLLSSREYEDPDFDMTSYDKDRMREYLGVHFRQAMNVRVDATNAEAGDEFLRQYVLNHLTDFEDKFRSLLFMVRKLLALVQGECSVDDADSSQHHELLLPGYLYAVALRGRLDEYLNSLLTAFSTEFRLRPAKVDIQDKAYMTKIIAKPSADIGSKMQYFISTGTLILPSMNISQESGFTVVAEKINYLRFISHFRSVHRGHYYTTMKTTKVRKLAPESWGFMCPVHTPDGAPCGLLTHLAQKCKISTTLVSQTEDEKLAQTLFSIGVGPADDISKERNVAVNLNGRIVGWCTISLAQHVVDSLRTFKISSKHEVSEQTTFGFIPPSKGGQFSGLFIYTTPARMLRPVRHIASRGQFEIISPFEQVYMNIAVFPSEIVADRTTHVEISATDILSIVANLTPFSDFNQSPRNMYQCQMAKQTMGTAGITTRFRADDKTYRLQTPQTPIVRPKVHKTYGMDNYASGTNAVVAVISYTGYDMEDAMILNKSSHERGFAYGTIYKTEQIDLSQIAGRLSTLQFGYGSDRPTKLPGILDYDGLPQVGKCVKNGEALAAYWDTETGRTTYKAYKSTEVAYIDQVLVLGSDSKTAPCQRVHIILRVPRSPVIGDKFSSRHGQKGVCSQKWPSVNMPFSESGIQPDIIINPHAFPSRMTVRPLENLPS